MACELFVLKQAEALAKIKKGRRAEEAETATNLNLLSDVTKRKDKLSDVRTCLSTNFSMLSVVSQ